MDTLDRIKPPAAKALNAVNPLDAVQTKLDNQIPLHILHDSAAELTRIEFIFSNPIWSAQKPLSAMVTGQLLTHGTTESTAAQLADEIDYYGAFLQTTTGYTRSGLTLYCLSKHLPSTLPIVREMLCKANFQQKELDTFVKNSKQNLQISLQKNSYLARQKFLELLFGSNTMQGYNSSLADYDALQRDDLVLTHKAQYHPKGCHLIASGKVSQQEKLLINRIFGLDDWEYKGTDLAAAQQELYPESKAIKAYVHREESVQSTICIGKRLFNKTHPDYHDMKILNTILGGYFGSRLMSNIREDKGYTYNIGSGITSLTQTGYFFISTEVGTAVCQKALVEIYKEIDKLKEEPVSLEELNLVRNYLLGSFQGDLENIFSHADMYKQVLHYNLDYQYYTDFFTCLKNIKPEQLQNLAKKYFTADWIEVVAGKMEQ